MAKIPISTVILTKNESSKIRDCINSVKDDIDEVIVIDDISTDDTIEIAQKLADKVIIRKMSNEGSHRNWAYS